MRADREGGQAAVELVAILPLVLAVALTAATVLAGLAASEQAGQAAEAGAIALIQGRDARAAARGAIPGLARSRTEVAIAGSRVTVRVRPPLPLGFLVAALEATTTADAGPEPGW